MCCAALVRQSSTAGCCKGCLTVAGCPEEVNAVLPPQMSWIPRTALSYTSSRVICQGLTLFYTSAAHLRRWSQEHSAPCVSYCSVVAIYCTSSKCFHCPRFLNKVICVSLLSQCFKQVRETSKIVLTRRNSVWLWCSAIKHFQKVENVANEMLWVGVKMDFSYSFHHASVEKRWKLNFHLDSSYFRFFVLCSQIRCLTTVTLCGSVTEQSLH